MIARAGKPVLKLVRVEGPPSRRVLGGWEHFKGWTDEEWWALDAEILADFEASITEPIEGSGAGGEDAVRAIPCCSTATPFSGAFKLRIG